MKLWSKMLGMLVMAGLLTMTTTVSAAWAQGGPGGERPRPPMEQSARPDHALRAIVDPAAIKQAIAEALGLTVAELDAAHEAGTPLAELAATQGVTLEAVQAAAKAAAIAQVNQALADGKITQDVADRLIAQINNHDFPLAGPGADHPRPDDGLRAILDHAVIKAVVAETLGLTVAELNAAHAAGTTLEEVAAAQGVTLEAVQAAAQAVAVAQINQAVTDGKITQAVADMLIERITNSDFPLGGPGAGHPQPDHGLRALLDQEAIKATIATALGLTVADLDAAREAGTTLEELAASQGVAFETVQAAAKAAAIAQVNQAVTDGKITQAEADRLIDQINNSDFPLPHRPGTHPHEQPGTDNVDETTPSTDETGQGTASAQEVASAIISIFLPVVNR